MTHDNNQKDGWDLEIERMPWRFNPRKPDLRDALLQMRALGFNTEADVIASELLSIQKTRAREAEAYILLSAAWPVLVNVGRTSIADQISEFLAD